MKKSKQKVDRSNWLIAAGIWGGLGVGLLTGQIWGFVLLGFGLGILGTFLVTRKRR
jgi:hypothetical protein